MRKFNRSFVLKCLTLCFFFVFSSYLYADPPGRVARLTNISGEVSFLAGGLEEWVKAVHNRPMTIGDRLWTDQDARLELQLGNSKICVADNTALSILNLDNRNVQFQLSEGRVNILINKLATNENYEIDTPNTAFVITKPGSYRVEVDPNTNKTNLTVFTGAGEVYGEQNSYLVAENQSFQFSNTDLSYQTLEITKDDWDDRCFNVQTVKSHEYVSSAVVGVEDLDTHGTWQEVSNYGHVWVPNEVIADWKPYYYGQWVWSDPWGWTWVDDASWGFAPFHYGRWAYIDSYWAWVPGPIVVDPIYSPALVSFFSLDGLIGWFALGYNEFYWPPYAFSPAYIENINISNTYLTSIQINNFYNKKVQQKFINFNPHSITAVTHNNFLSGKKMSSFAKQVDNNLLKNAKESNHAPVAPTQKNIAGGEKITRPVPKVFDKQTIVKKTPPAPKIPFAKEEAQLSKSQGKPLDSSEIEKLQTKEQPANIKSVPKTVTRPSETLKSGGKSERKPSEMLKPATKSEIPPSSREPNEKAISPVGTPAVKTISKPERGTPPTREIQKTAPVQTRPSSNLEQDKSMMQKPSPLQREQQNEDPIAPLAPKPSREIQRPEQQQIMPGRELTEPQPERVQPQRPMIQPQQDRSPSRREAIQPQQQRQMMQPSPERVQPQPQRQMMQPQSGPERVQPQPQRQMMQPQPERVQQQPQRQMMQPSPERVQPQPQRQMMQPQPERVQPQPQRQMMQPQPRQIESPKGVPHNIEKRQDKEHKNR